MRTAGAASRPTPSVPALGSETPRCGNVVSRAFGRAAMRVLGWRFAGEVPNLPRLVGIVAPHTAAWDFIVGLSGLFALGVKVSWLGKHTIFRPPLGTVLRWLGGIPVDRRAPGGFVAQAVERFNRAGPLYLALAPEGTRQRTERWKTGFHRIARAARVPVVPVWLDYRAKVIGIGPPQHLTDDVTADLERLGRFFEPAMARRPDRFAHSASHEARRTPG